MAAEGVAQAFHEAYERLAPEHGYRTRKASAKPWAEVPADNRSLMIATVSDLMHRKIIAPVTEDGDISDGYHTFGELYAHRRALTAALIKALLAGYPGEIRSWKSREHHPDDDPMFEGGYFILGVDLPTGTITYHYKLSRWDDFPEAEELEHAPKWDGAGPDATVERLLAWAKE